MEIKNQNLDHVLDKLRKIKLMYEGAKKINSEGEANAAAAAIQRLLIQYNLSMEEIGSDDQKKADIILEEKGNGYTYKSIGGVWELRLVTVLCKWNFCECFQWGRSYKVFLMFGKKENLETVKWLRNLLSERFVDFSKENFKKYKKTEEYINHPISKDKYQRSYLMGCTFGLDAKLKEESDLDKNKDEDFNVKVNALIVRNNSAISEYLKDNYKIAKGGVKHVSHDSSFEKGFNDGKHTKLYKEVSSNAKKQTKSIKLLG